jgi:glycosyltransferase involved in cell wall biosynthesis
MRFGGEASLPLHYFSRLRARGVETWLVVHGRTRDELESLYPAEQDRIRYIPDRWYHRLIWKLGLLFPRRISEAVFGNLMVLVNQLTQRKMIRKLILECNVNIVHQPVPVSPKAPSLISALGIPVVIGPMNGGMSYPPGFRTEESRLTRISVAFARASADLANIILNGKRRASVLLVANKRSRDALPSGTRGEILEMPENGVDLSIWTLPQTMKEFNAEVRLIFIGRLVAWKRLDLLIHAVSKLTNANLAVIGDGDMRREWTALTEQLGIAQRVSWLGWLPQIECAQRLHSAFALVLPSIYECGGAVVLEAMACGIPVIATRWGGPADYIDEGCGVLVDPSTSSSIIDGLVAAIQLLAGNPLLRSQLSEGARARAALFGWDLKIDRMVEIYRQCVADYQST